jgi:hypothetical protein
MVLTEIITVYGENLMDHVNTKCGQNAGLKQMPLCSEVLMEEKDLSQMAPRTKKSEQFAQNTSDINSSISYSSTGNLKGIVLTLLARSLIQLFYVLSESSDKSPMIHLSPCSAQQAAKPQCLHSSFLPIQSCIPSLCTQFEVIQHTTLQSSFKINIPDSPQNRTSKNLI